MCVYLLQDFKPFSWRTRQCFILHSITASTMCLAHGWIQNKIFIKLCVTFWIYHFNYKYIKGWNVGITSLNPIKFVICSLNNIILVPRKWPIYPDQVTAKWFKKLYINVTAIYDFKSKFECGFNYRLHSKFHCKKVIHACCAL